jgi:hypothetical protein
VKFQTWCKGKHFQGFCQIFSRLIADNHLNESIPAVVDIRLVPFVIVGCGRYEVRLLLVHLQPSAPARSLVELQLHKYTLKTARVLKKTAAVFEKSARVLRKTRADLIKAPNNLQNRVFSVYICSVVYKYAVCCVGCYLIRLPRCYLRCYLRCY